MLSMLIAALWSRSISHPRSGHECQRVARDFRTKGTSPHPEHVCEVFLGLTLTNSRPALSGGGGNTGVPNLIVAGRYTSFIRLRLFGSEVAVASSSRRGKFLLKLQRNFCSFGLDHEKWQHSLQGRSSLIRTESQSVYVSVSGFDAFGSAYLAAKESLSFLKWFHIATRKANFKAIKRVAIS